MYNADRLSIRLDLTNYSECSAITGLIFGGTGAVPSQFQNRGRHGGRPSNNLTIHSERSAITGFKPAGPTRGEQTREQSRGREDDAPGHPFHPHDSSKTFRLTRDAARCNT